MTLTAPTPLDRPLRLEADADEARLLDGERPLARARRADGELLAQSRTTWIAMDEVQLAAFTAR